MTTTCNGWTNYATWRVNLEVFDGLNPHDMEWPTSLIPLTSILRDYAEEFILDTTGEGIGRDYALAFISDVDWQQIADHMIETYSEVA